MNLVNLESLDVMVLPSLPYLRRSQLPVVSCVYFVVDNKNVVRYIGQTNALKKRWRGPNKPYNPPIDSRIFWLEVQDPPIRRMLERRFIRRFQPSQNHQGILPSKPFVNVSLRLSKEMYIALDLLSDRHGRSLKEEALFLIAEAIQVQQ